MSTGTSTSAMLTWHEACERLECSPFEGALDSVIEEGLLTPIYLGERVRFYRYQIERLAEKFGLEGDEKVAA